MGVDLVGPINLPTSLGTVLITPPPGGQIFLNPAPGTPFALAIPFDCQLIGQSAWAQGGSVSPGPTIALTNGLDITFGTF